MYHTCFFQKRLAEALDVQLVGLVLVQCFSQQKDELILSFSSKQKEFHIKADFGNNAGLLAFQNQFARARKNSIDLFQELIDQKVTACTAFRQDRSFQIDFQGDYCLIFKMHASRSNVLLCRDNQVERIFRNNLVKDICLIPDELNNNNNLTDALFTKLKGRGFEYVTRTDIETMTMSVGMEGPTLLFGKQSGWFQTTDAIIASNKYAEFFYRSVLLEREKEKLTNKIDKQLKQGKKYIAKNESKLEEVKSMKSPEEIGHLIMANLHSIKSGEKSVILKDFYSDQDIIIKLNPKLSPQLNAEHYYRKHKKRKIEVYNLEKNISEKLEFEKELKRRLQKVASVKNLKELRQLSTGFFGEQVKNEVALPYHIFEFKGWQILVGKNAKSNDHLTLKIAKKNDLWLHVKDVSGSHVVIKERAGQNFPKSVIEKAASIAAYYSRRKTDSLSPVIFTPKKYVRKVKGSPPGMVIVDREEVIMVEPDKMF